MPTFGGYDLYTIETGRFGLDGGAMFGVVPKALWEKRLAPDDQNRIPLALRCLLLVGHGRVILIDSGIGHKSDEKFARIFAIDHEHATLEHSLKQVGVGLDDVTDLILTHLHFDHAGGATRYEGDRLVPTFSNARVHIQKTHWEWASASNPKERASFRTENFEPLQAAGQVVLVEDAFDLPHLSPLVVDGHTQGQQLVKVQGADRVLLYAADLFPTLAHLQPVWNMAYDIYPMTSIDEKQVVLTQVVEERWTLFLEHDPQVEVVEVEQTNGRFRASAARFLQEL